MRLLFSAASKALLGLAAMAALLSLPAGSWGYPGAWRLIFLTIPVVLGSWWALPLFLPYPLLMALRIRGEEALLRREFHGYKEYVEKVKWRMVPFVW